MTYACTAEVSCSCTFEKYTDWCTHEVMAHKTDLNVWFCGDPSDDSPRSCNIGFRNVEEFRGHRYATHNDPSVNCSDYALGPQAGVRFYCGFCRLVLTINEDEKDQWATERLKHISVHFKAGRTKGDWTHLPMYWVFTDGFTTKKDLQFTAHSSTL
jgi:hypothetical protein